MAVGFPTILGVLLFAVNGLGWLLRQHYCPCGDAAVPGTCSCLLLTTWPFQSPDDEMWKIDDSCTKEGSSCVDVKHIMRHGFMGFYVLAVVLLVFYFSNEDLPCHENQTREHVYLSVVLGVIVSGSTLVWWDPSKRRVFLEYEQLQHFLLLIFAVQIEQRMAAPERLSGFFDRRADSGGPFFGVRRPVITTQGARVAARLAELETQGLRLGAGVLASIPIQSFSWVILSLLMLLQCMFQRAWLIQKMHSWLPYCWLAVAALLAYDGCKKRFRADPIRRQILHLVEGACEDENVLRHLLWSNNVPTLFEVGGSDLIELLSRHPVLQKTDDIVEKAIFVDALMKMGLKWRSRQQAAVRELILGLHGKDATTFKNLIDGGGDYHNLWKLVFVDISSKQVRREIRLHLAREGEQLRAQGGGKPRPVGIKVLSDVDDTLHCSGGKWPAGCDTSLPKHTVYPGSLKLFSTLDSSHNPEEPSCSLIFMSARPHFYKSALEDHSYHRFKVLVEEDRMHTMPTLLAGELWRSVWAALTQPCRKTRAWRRVGRFKHRTFRNFAQLYPEYDFVFCGDDGQGDLLAGQMMVCDAGDLQDADGTASETEGSTGSDDAPPCAERPGDDLPEPNVRAVLIHHVMPEEAALALERPEERGPAWRDRLRRRRLYFFDTYVGAAAALYEANTGLMPAECLRKVADDAARNFEADVSYYENEKAGFKWGPFEDMLRRDLARANELLISAGLQAIQEPSASTTFMRSNSRQSCGFTPLAGDTESGDSRGSEDSEDYSKLLE